MVLLITSSSHYLCHFLQSSPRQFYPQVGWVKHDPMEIMESVKIYMSKAIDKATVDGHNVDGGLKAIGLTNQRETTVVWSKSIGLHLYNTIVWMDVCTNSLFIH
ncbi:hypothetical protein CsSME_00004134 [Camellia sinensis var. sinensis]